MTLNTNSKTDGEASKLKQIDKKLEKRKEVSKINAENETKIKNLSLSSHKTDLYSNIAGQLDKVRPPNPQTGNTK